MQPRRESNYYRKFRRRRQSKFWRRRRGGFSTEGFEGRLLYDRFMVYRLEAEMYNKGEKLKHKQRMEKYSVVDDDFDMYNSIFVVGSDDDDIGDIDNNNLATNEKSSTKTLDIFLYLKHRSKSRNYQKKLNKCIMITDDDDNEEKEGVDEKVRMGNNVEICYNNNNNNKERKTTTSSNNVICVAAMASIRRQKMRLNITLNQHKAAMKQYKSKLNPKFTIPLSNDEMTKDAIKNINNDIVAPASLTRLTSAPTIISSSLFDEETIINEYGMNGDNNNNNNNIIEWDDGKEYCKKINIVPSQQFYLIYVKSTINCAAIGLVITKAPINSMKYVDIKVLPLFGITISSCIDVITNQLRNVTSISDMVGPTRKYDLLDILNTAIMNTQGEFSIKQKINISCLRVGLKKWFGHSTSSITNWQVWDAMIRDNGVEEEEEEKDCTKSAQPLLGKMVCNICFSVFDSPRQGATLPGCEDHASHWFCNDCWKDYLENASKDPGFDFTCPRYDCVTKIPHDTLLALVPNASAYTRLLHFKVEQYVRNAESETVFDKDDNYDFDACTKATTRWCPDPKCNRLMSLSIPLSKTGYGNNNCNSTVKTPGSKVFICDCGLMVCANCGKEPHIGTTCETLKKFKIASNGMDAEAKSDLFIKMNSRECPKCKFRIIRYTGCNHVRCMKCQYYMCYACGGPGTECNAYQCKKGNTLEKKFEKDREEAQKQTNDVTVAHKAARLAYESAKKFTNYLARNHELFTIDEATIFSRLIESQYMVYFIRLKEWAVLCKLLRVRLNPQFRSILLQAEVTAQNLKEHAILIESRLNSHNGLNGNKKIVVVQKHRRISKRKQQSLLKRGIVSKKHKKKLHMKSLLTSSSGKNTIAEALTGEMFSRFFSVLFVTPSDLLSPTGRKKKSHRRKNRKHRAENMLVRKEKFSKKNMKHAPPWKKSQRKTLGSNNKNVEKVKWKGKEKAKALNQMRGWEGF